MICLYLKTGKKRLDKFVKYLKICYHTWKHIFLFLRMQKGKITWYLAINIILFYIPIWSVYLLLSPITIPITIIILHLNHIRKNTLIRLKQKNKAHSYNTSNLCHNNNFVNKQMILKKYRNTIVHEYANKYSWTIIWIFTIISLFYFYNLISWFYIILYSGFTILLFTLLYSVITQIISWFWLEKQDKKYIFLSHNIDCFNEDGDSIYFLNHYFDIDSIKF